MDEKREELQTLGAFGIVGEAFRILRCRPKLFRTITLARILPLCIASVAHASIAVPLLLKIGASQKKISRQLTDFLLIEAGYEAYAFSMWWLSMAAVINTVADVYSGDREPSLATVTKICPGFWRRAAITSLWVFIIIFAVSAAYGFSMFLLVLCSDRFTKLFAELYGVALMIVCVAFVSVCVYMRTVWEVASVVSVLEKKYYGLEAVIKSHRLIKEKGGTATALTVMYLIFESFHGYAVVVLEEWGAVLKVESFATLFVVLSLLGCMVVLMRALMTSVLYFVCKSYHQESVDELCLLDGPYLPVKRDEIQDFSG